MGGVDRNGGAREPVDRRLFEAAAEQHGCLRRDEAWALGASPSMLSRRVRDGRLVVLQPGTYTVPALLDDRSHLAAMCLRRHVIWASHRSAAALHGLDGLVVDVVEVTVPIGVKLVAPGVHRSADLAPFELTDVDGIPCTDATRTLCDLGAVVGDDALELALESALRRGLTSVSRLRWRLEQLARPGRAGPAALRRVLDRRPGDAEPTASELETRFLQTIRGTVPDPVRQHPVPLRGGGIAYLDDAWPEERVFAELDGWRWHGDRTAFGRDRRRQNAVVLEGWLPLRFTWHDVVNDPAGTARTVSRALASRRSPSEGTRGLPSAG